MSIANLFTPNAYQLYAGSIQPGIINDSSGAAGSAGQGLISNGTTLTWAPISVALANISGLSIGSAAANQGLLYNGTNFVNAVIPHQMSFNSALVIINGEYIGPAGLISSYNGAASLAPQAITITSIAANLSTNPLVGTVTFTLYVNGSASSLSVAIAAGSTYGIATGSVAIAAGNTYAIKCTISGLATLSIAQVAMGYNY